MSHAVLIIGAGSSGRGHLGQLAHEAGWDLVFADTNAELVRALKQAGRYTVRLCRATTERKVVVDRFRVYRLDEVDALVREGLSVPLILTCVFSQNLPAVAPLVARVIEARQAAGVDQPLNVVCCENMQHGSSRFKSMVDPLLAPAAASYAAANVGFPDAMISRVVPLATGNPLELVAEDYNEWTVDDRRFVGKHDDLPCMELVNNQDARLARKFFMHNTTHAICAYWGFHRGHAFVHEAIADARVRDRVLRAIDELAPVVAKHYGFAVETCRAYGQELGARGAVAALQDRILRVVRDPLRKLSRSERLVAPALLVLEDGLPCGELVQGMAAALRYFHPDDPQAVALRERLRVESLPDAVADITGLTPNHALVEQVCTAYRSWPD